MKQKPQNNRPEPAAAPSGTRGDIARLREAAAATGEEFSEFLTRMRGKSTTEVLGAVARSGLTGGVVLSLVLHVVVLAGFTVGPYLYEKKFGRPEPVAKKKDAREETPEPTPQPKVDPKTAKAKDPDSKDPKGDVIKKMGVSDTKIADPKVNPLDKGLDDLLNK